MIALLWLVIVAVPLLALFGATLRTQDDYLDNGPLAFPDGITGDNYLSVFDKGFGTALGNTVMVTAGTVLLVMITAIPAAYAIVRSPSRIVSSGFRMFLLGLAIPMQVTVVPIYLVITRLHLYDSLLAVVLPTAAFSLPVSVLILASAMRDVSEEVYESMALDGAGSWRVLLNLVVPMSTSAIATIGIYSALQAWNGFLFPLVLTQSADQRVLTLSLWEYQTQFGINVPGLLAAVVLSGLPIFIAYLFARRALTSGLMGVGGK
ncbi:carbohydrate ABC transporter permease [Kibdelosporangium persicum]|uniref:Inner membrane ABC transporter permease protein YcjP n=1 Tax=Kibdelosporangium persicum TaxID=2698649 RepID=A0ABX2EZK9_9PSEU|nr:carbohydrate ABC transporter permease [Kibdelosporangium persicum]NRN64496.1 Inner membrane ABC transporter permease protein YcjP [Kibdelosporangium persicum]